MRGDITTLVGFMRYGNVFLFFEVMKLRREIEILKSRIQASFTTQQTKR